jgi:agmatine/peptidylarginine deiminase
MSWQLQCLCQEHSGHQRLRGYSVPGEFESQDALLLDGDSLVDSNPRLFLDLVAQLQDNIDLLLLVSGNKQCEAAKLLLDFHSIPRAHVHFAELPHDTMWTRDYGPIVVMSQGEQAVFVDAFYSIDRGQDDGTPSGLAEMLRTPVVRIPVRIDGGNLLFNGDGLAVTTTRLWNDNSGSELDELSMRELMMDAYGLRQILTLQPLQGEPTGHVDMFVTFVSRNTVLVGKYDSMEEPENAAVLDQNAAELAKVQTSEGPLQVIRVPMPRHTDGIWRTYTNVIYANGVVLVPSYPDIGEPGLAETLAIFQDLLPGWNVVPVDTSNLIEFSGALHCLSMNLAKIGRLPDFPVPLRHPGEPLQEFRPNMVDIAGLGPFRIPTAEKAAQTRAGMSRMWPGVDSHDFIQLQLQ